LSPDPDREGEAIAWHIQSILPKSVKIKRAVFYSITKEAVVEALQHPKTLDMDLVNAQQARRLLDRIVGYKISPILQRRVARRGAQGGLSAGRVQSVALKLVVDRERAIENFVPIEYWNLGAELKAQKDKKAFFAQLYSVDQKRIEKEPQMGKKVFLIPDEETATEIKQRLEKSTYTIEKVEKREKKRHAPPPFITSTIQQEASRHLGFAPARTMQIAQQLYEGIDLGPMGFEGLITYMRTDSVRISKEGLDQARQYIGTKLGKEFLPLKPLVYSAKKQAQDAHEAIRPTHLDHAPEQVAKYLDHDQNRLYALIWKRFVASQMNPAIYDTVSCHISASENLELRATGSQIKFLGYLSLYQEKDDDVMEEKGMLLPNLQAKEMLKFLKAKADQAFTRPPPRFTEASLVKELEKSGVGRPSTYAAIMNKIQSRSYTTKEDKRLVPTELGKVICAFLETNFPKVMNISFTSEMEDDLEKVARGEKKWKTLLKDFWKDFKPVVEEAEKSAFVPKIETDRKCPKCGKNLQKIWSRSKYFLGCSGYPDCPHTESLAAKDFRKEDYAQDFDWDQKCPKCTANMTLRHGQFGAFLGCEKYPDCKGIVNIPPKGEEIIEIPCPATGCSGKVVRKMSRYGKPFYSCNTFPDCDVIVNNPDDLKTKYSNHPKTAYVQKKRSSKRGKLTPNAKLAKIVGKEPISRGQMTKKIWEYIKKHDLQDPKNRRSIIADSNLKPLFNAEAVDMFQLARIISQNIE
ncbi:MAG: hypothetical protein K940chlam8_01283, partial [Chlamydiae bacterium]|nr:hypothetical protein [Chlamydiota bacterium]